MFKNDRFLIFGHRGAPDFAPENTIVSFEKAIEYGVNAIELDVLLTNDDKVVVFHDFDLKRLANKSDKINELSYDELKYIDISQGWLNHFGIQRIPLLDNVIKLIKKYNIILNIEIKSMGVFPTKIVEKVNELIIQNNFESNCIISSFNPLIIRRMRKVNPNLFTSLIWSREEVSFIQRFYKFLYLIANPNGFHPDKNFINSKIVNWAKSKGMPIYVFTVNSLEDLKKLKKYNIDGVFTDNPKLVNSN